MGLNLSNITKISGRSGLNITKIRRRSDGRVLWSKNYYFDLNGADNGLVDVYINGSLVASGVSDYYEQHPYGSTYEIKNIRPKSGYNYDGVTGGSLSGTITGATTVTLSFSVAHVHTSACYHTHTDSCYAEDNYAECGNCGRTEGDWAIGEECSCGGTFGEAVHRYLVCNIPEGTKTCGYE